MTDGFDGIFQRGSETNKPLDDYADRLKFMLRNRPYGDGTYRPILGDFTATAELPPIPKLPTPGALDVMADLSADLGEDVTPEDAEQIRALLAEEDEKERAEEIKAEQVAQGRSTVDRWKHKPWKPEPDGVPF